MYFLIVIAVVTLDQILKFLISSRMALFQSIPILGDFVSLTYIHNTGAAFSILQNQRFLLTVFPVLMIALLLGFLLLRRKREHPVVLWGTALIVAGGAGNLIDRIRLGYVVDFIDLHFFPIFNIADIAVCTGCGLIVLYLLMLERRQGREQVHRGRE